MHCMARYIAWYIAWHGILHGMVYCMAWYIAYFTVWHVTCTAWYIAWHGTGQPIIDRLWTGSAGQAPLAVAQPLMLEYRSSKHPA